MALRLHERPERLSWWRVALALAATGIAAATMTTSHPTAAAPARCEEDDPCWDCATMGNQLCGPDPATKENQP